MRVTLDPSSIVSYRQFLAIKKLPAWSIRGRVAEFPDEYAQQVMGINPQVGSYFRWNVSPGLFDYQAAIVEMAIRKRKFAVFADCGLGKTNILLEFASCAHSNSNRNVLIVCPLMVVKQTVEEARTFYPSLEIDVLRASGLAKWMQSTGRVGIVNYEAITESLPNRTLGGLILDESSMLKSHYGKWASKLIEMGRGAEWKLACTGTPAPNDRIEYANHAVFLDAYPTVNSFLATYFVNRGQTQERWVLKDHAIGPFYRALSHWCIFLTNPATYGWEDNCENIPPINVHVHQVDLTPEQREAMQRLTGAMFAKNAGGITTRSIYSQLAKGKMKQGGVVKSVPTNKYRYVESLVSSWPDESTIIWCQYNDEQDELERVFPDAASIRGSTPDHVREGLVDAFKRGERKVMISKPKILGFGLNLQVATRQVFSGLSDSYESYYQAVKRSNRYGSTRPLNVHIPVTELEEPMVHNVLRKAAMVQQDTEMQERMFRDASAQ